MIKNENSAEKAGTETEDRAENVREEAKDASENVTETAENANGTVATVYNVGEIKENVPPSAKIIAVMGSKALGETFSDISIPQNQKKSIESKL